MHLYRYASADGISNTDISAFLRHPGISPNGVMTESVSQNAAPRRNPSSRRRARTRPAIRPPRNAHSGLDPDLRTRMNGVPSASNVVRVYLAFRRIQNIDHVRFVIVFARVPLWPGSSRSRKT